MLSARTAFQFLAATLVVCAGAFSGCGRGGGVVIPVDVDSSVDVIVADEAGAWIALTSRASYELGKPLPPNYCILRRYDRKGAVAKEVALGKGLLRRFTVGETGALALVVGDPIRTGGGSAELPVDLWLAGRDGAGWHKAGRLPCSAIGAARMTPQAMLVWDERRVFHSSDEGQYWAEVHVRPRGAGQGVIARECVVFGGADGGLLLALVSFGTGGQATTKLGLLDGDLSFRLVTVFPGRVAGMAEQEDGSVLLVANEDTAEMPGAAVYHLRDPRSPSPSLERVHREERVLPKALVMDRDRGVVLGSKWRIPSSFLSAFPVRCFGLVRGQDARWKAETRSDLEREEPGAVAFAPDGSAWLYRSTFRKHEVVRFDSEPR